MPLELEGKAIPVDDEGYLLDPAEWDDRVAGEFASREGIELSEAHWAVIRYMREYYDNHQIIPDARHVIKFLAGYLGGAGTGRNDLFALFPYGYVKQACRIAGMRRPRAWSTG
jgi:tRNA 2-thiouridine synthesizing protein E